MKPRILPLGLLLLGGCAFGGLQSPAQPTFQMAQMLYDQNAALHDTAGNPLPAETVWELLDGSVRAACHVYLNGAASQQANLSLLGQGIGVAGAAGSFFNPGAGVGASLAQTFLAGFASSGYVPTTGDAILVGNYLNTYESAVGVPASVPIAISWADDEWYHCSAGGISELAMLSKSTATFGTTTAAGFLAPRNLRYSSRPVIVVNPR